MSLSIGIVGLPNVGKSTLFNALTRKSVPAENYPFCTIDPSVGMVAVPDSRLDRLAELSQSAQKIPAVVEFVDIAGLVQGASAGGGLGNQFLAHIREVDAIAEVVRVFDDPDISHVHGDVRPMDDIEVINLELVMADLQTVSRRMAALEKEIKSGDREAAFEQEVIQAAAHTLEAGRLVQYTGLDGRGYGVLKKLHLLTLKPILYVLNVKSGSAPLREDARRELKEFLAQSGAAWVEVDAAVESELKDVSVDEKQQFRRELGVLDDGVDNLIRAGYKLLDLITFFTTGPKETRAWTVRRGMAAPEAGAAIHSDFRDRFIRAEVIHSEELFEAGGYPAARGRGLVRTEGKDYVVRDGDVIEFKI